MIYIDFSTFVTKETAVDPINNSCYCNEYFPLCLTHFKDRD